MRVAKHEHDAENWFSDMLLSKIEFTKKCQKLHHNNIVYGLFSRGAHLDSTSGVLSRPQNFRVPGFIRVLFLRKLKIKRQSEISWWRALLYSQITPLVYLSFLFFCLSRPFTRNVRFVGTRFNNDNETVWKYCYAS